ncbi:hypothetical protein MPN29_03845 [Riemerella anatipestifer]|uniref:YD repeat-containing protein n=1 Tax=Riemerella anatipestifer TaxID=34085 RepID=A0AAP6HFK5_RIEAN|nr:hypothetical protein [Riemerella anatipestifer]MBT0549685.1 hypothetical protein [Riemerella anatipestifer]MBT0556469.1 hypothetical protein [Riemerella anatipestifer]MBT0560448.1 hypothetical protein [Riemerella anatipestifer]MCD5968944.1 hypothetical protein [Riemerella anatipestifer]MCO7354403.1 hypothetical protein [Riemerella anatipestifer]
MKKVFYLLSMAILPAFLAVSCNRNDDESTPTPKEELLLPSKAEEIYYDKNGNPKRTSVYDFTYDGTKLTKLVSRDGEGNTAFTYQDDLITKIKSNEEERIFEYDSKGNLSKETLVESYNSATITHVYTYTLNGNSVSVTYSKKNVAGEKLRSEAVGAYTYTLTPNKQVIRGVGKKTSTDYYDSGYSYTYDTTKEENYTYDDKNSIFKNVGGFDKLGYSQFILNAPFGSFNNVLTKNRKEGVDNTRTYTHTEAYRYTYNDKNFPTEFENSVDDKKYKTSKIEYKTVTK